MVDPHLPDATVHISNACQYHSTVTNKYASGGCNWLMVVMFDVKQGYCVRRHYIPVVGGTKDPAVNFSGRDTYFFFFFLQKYRLNPLNHIHI